MANPIFLALIDPIARIIDKFIPDKDLAKKLAQEVTLTVEQQIHREAIGQIEINKQEAAHKSLFVAGWRPFIGWTCGFSLFFNFIGAPITNWACELAGLTTSINGVETIITVPVLDISTMMPVLLGMLGLGTMRTFEKKHGVAREK